MVSVLVTGSVICSCVGECKLLVLVGLEVVMVLVLVSMTGCERCLNVIGFIWDDKWCWRW